MLDNAFVSSRRFMRLAGFAVVPA
ncbi:hypothetical protein PSCLAVI8L_130316 [Pseudoclavibacter sp. 8L]|nr:hypothetical protein PSCLAVI8L_130316 [Pseudoclavibacter sp. 8L]